MSTGEDLEKPVQKATRVEGDGAALCRQSHDGMPKMMQSQKIAQNFINEGGRSGHTDEYGRPAIADGQPDPRHDRIKQIAGSGDYGNAAELVRNDLRMIELGKGTPAQKLEAQKQYMTGLTNELGTGFVFNAAKQELIYDLKRAGGPPGSEVHIDISHTVLGDNYSRKALVNRNEPGADAPAPIPAPMPAMLDIKPVVRSQAEQDKQLLAQSGDGQKEQTVGEQKTELPVKREIPVKKDAEDKPDPARDGEQVKKLYFAHQYEQAAQLLSKRIKQIENGPGTPQQKANAEEDYAYDTLTQAGFTDLQLGHGFHVGPGAKQGIIHFEGTALGDRLSNRPLQDHSVAKIPVAPAVDHGNAQVSSKSSSMENTGVSKGADATPQVSSQVRDSGTTLGDSTTQVGKSNQNEPLVKQPMPTDRSNYDSAQEAGKLIREGNIARGVAIVNKRLMQIEHSGGSPEAKRDMEWNYIQYVCSANGIQYAPTGDFHFGEAGHGHDIKLTGTAIGDHLSRQPLKDRTKLVPASQLTANDGGQQKPDETKPAVTYESGKPLTGRAEEKNKINPGGDPLKTGAEYDKAYLEALANANRTRETTESTETVEWDNWRFGIQKHLTDAMRPYISQYLNHNAGAVSFNFDVGRNGQIYDIHIQGNPRNPALEAACQNAVIGMSRNNLLKFPASSQLQQQNFNWPLYYGNIPEGTGYQRGDNETIRRKQQY